MKKKLYANGVFVCEYESTGDNLKDMELCQNILAQRGIHKEITPIQAMFRQAVSFSQVAAGLYRDINASPQNGLFAAPFVVNSVFSIELYLKTLAAIHGRKLENSHELTKLFDVLPEAAHTAMKSVEPSIREKWGVPSNADYRQCLADLNNAFVEWRYLHERDNTPEVRIAHMIFVMEVLHEACRKSGMV